MRYIGYILYLILAALSAAYGQSPPDTTVDLPLVTIVSGRDIWSSTGQVRESIDSLSRLDVPGGSLAELLDVATSLTINSYGPGSLATMKMRGTSANHSGILWNGIQVSPPNIGYLDLSLISGDLFGHIDVLYGGASPQFGTGWIGGGIMLSNPPVFTKGLKKFSFRGTAGSFGLLSGEGQIELAGSKYYSKSSATCRIIRNDFTYQDLYGQKQRMTHGEINQFGGMQTLAVKTGKDQYLMGSFWLEYADRNIPPTLTESQSQANQVDRSYRSMISWKDFNPRNTLEIKGAYFNEYTRYSDPLALVYSVIRSQYAFGSAESEWKILSAARIFAGASYTYQKADLTNYSVPQEESIVALYSSFLLPLKFINWKLSWNMREEVISGQWTPFTFSLGLEGIVKGPVKGRLNFSRNYRWPTMNERFWVPGGNPDLKPETSWNLEGGIDLNTRGDKNSFRGGLTFFYSLVDNWILWVPEGSFWTVKNRQEVWSRGVEIIGGFKSVIQTVIWFFDLSYSYTRATNEDLSYQTESSYKKQLIYTPLHQFRLRLGTGWKGYQLIIRNALTGKIYTSTDNAESLSGYYLLDLTAKKKISISGKYAVEVGAVLNNLLNTTYQVVPYRPMPGINYNVSVTFKFN